MRGCDGNASGSSLHLVDFVDDEHRHVTALGIALGAEHTCHANRKAFADPGKRLGGQQQVDAHQQAVVLEGGFEQGLVRQQVQGLLRVRQGGGEVVRRR